MRKLSARDATLLGIGAAIAACGVAKLLDELGEMSEEMALGYASENALPVAGQPGFPDTSGVHHPWNNFPAKPQNSA
jgi:hypothetical protein